MCACVCGMCSLGVYVVWCVVCVHVSVCNDEGDPSRMDINALLPQNKPYVVNE